MSDDICVCCGRIIPEGRMVCPVCEKEVNAKETFEEPQFSNLSDVSRTLHRWHDYFTEKKKIRLYDPGYEKLARIFPSVIGKMADTIDQALREGDQMSFLDSFKDK